MDGKASWVEVLAATLATAAAMAATSPVVEDLSLVVLGSGIGSSMSTSLPLALGDAWASEEDSAAACSGIVAGGGVGGLVLGAVIGSWCEATRDKGLDVASMAEGVDGADE